MVLKVGEATTFPPFGALYQTTDCPAGTLAVAVNVVGKQPCDKTVVSTGMLQADKVINASFEIFPSESLALYAIGVGLITLFD